MGIGFLLSQPFAQHALAAAALVAVTGGLISPFVVTRGMAFAVHGTAELAFTGAAAGLLVANNPVLGALAGSLVVAALIATLGARPRERDSAIGAILAFGMGIGILLLGYYQGFAIGTNILFGNIFGVSGGQLLILLAIGLIVVVVMGIWYRPLLFASIDPETAEARGVPVRRLGLIFLLVLALTVTGAAQVVGTLLVLSLAITALLPFKGRLRLGPGDGRQPGWGAQRHAERHAHGPAESHPAHDARRVWAVGASRRLVAAGVTGYWRPSPAS